MRDGAAASADASADEGRRGRGGGDGSSRGNEKPADREHAADESGAEPATEADLMAAGAARGLGAAPLASLRATVGRPHGGDGDGSGAASATALALACSAAVRVRSPVALRVASWAFKSAPDGGGGGGAAAGQHPAALAGEWAAAVRAASAAAGAKWRARMAQGHRAGQWQSVRDTAGGAASGGDRDAPALFFGAPFVLDLPPLPPGAVVKLRSNAQPMRSQ
jgi:hypothetical protein